MSPAVWHLLILWMTLVPRPAMCSTRSAYVSEFEYAPGLHPSRNPNCPSRYTGDRKACDEFDEWDRPSIEIRPVLSRCSTPGEEITPGGEYPHSRRKRRHDGERYRGTITNCTRKIVISMRFNNIGRTETEEKFVVIDHVLDPSTMKKIPLRDTYVIKVRQETILQMYGLKFQSVVNAEAREEVINNQTPNFTGCDADSDSPTCGRTFSHGQPVPFSQGFCCSCDSKLNVTHHANVTNEFRSRPRIKPDYEEAANEHRNRLPAKKHYAGSIAIPIAERQFHVNAVIAKKPSVVAESHRRVDDQPKRIQTTAPVEASSGEMHENRPVSAESARTKESSVSNSEKYSKKPVEVTTKRQAIVGKAAIRDETVSAINVARDRSFFKVNEVPPKKIDKPLASFEENRDRLGDSLTKLVAKSPSATADSTRRNVDRSRTESKVEEVGLGFRSTASRADIEKLSREKGRELSVNLSGDTVTVLSTKYSSVGELVMERLTPKKAKYESGGGGAAEKRKGRWPGTFHGNKGSWRRSGWKRGEKAYPATIDSLAIRPSMHLNEPLKNVSTGVSNSDRSPSERTERRGPGLGTNLNRVMEGPSTSRGITVATFNEKHGTGYFRSSRNDLDESCAESFDANNVSKTPVKAASVTRNGVVSTTEKACRAEADDVKNYTPQRRTLKDLSFARKKHDPRDRRKLKRDRDVIGYGSKTYVRRSRRQLGNGKNRRSARHERSGKLDVAFRQRGRRKAGGKRDNGDRGTVRQVYIDRSRNLRPSTTEESSRGGGREKIAEGRNVRKQDAKNGAKSREKVHGKSSVDERIEEKFSRISDVLKEDTLGPKGAKEQVKGDTSTDSDTVDDKHWTSSSGQETNNRLQPNADDESSRRSNDEIVEPHAVTADVHDEKLKGSKTNAEIDAKQGTSLSKELENESTGERVAGSQGNDPFLDEQLDSNYKSSTFDLEPVVSPTMGPPTTIEGSGGSSSSILEHVVDSVEDVQPFGGSNDNATSQTRSVIVVDLFRISNDTATEQPVVTSVKYDSKFLDNFVGLKKHIQKAFGKLKPVQKTPDIPESTTVMLSEATGTTMNAATETGVATTRITDEAFRPSLKATVTSAGGGAEFHNEVIIDETTIPEPTNVLTVSAPTPRREELAGLEPIFGNTEASVSKMKQPSTAGQRGRGRRRRRGWRRRRRRRRKRRRTPSAIKKRDLELVDKRVADDDPRGGNPRDYDGKKRPTRADSGIKFSFEAANENVVETKLGQTSSFSNERRNYLRLKVRDVDKQRVPRKREKVEIREAEADRVEDRTERREVVSDPIPTNLIAIKWIHHPWFVTTESSEITNAPKVHPNGPFSDKDGKKQNEADLEEEYPNLDMDEIQGRILQPCTKSPTRRGVSRPAKSSNVVCEGETNARGRKLLSVSGLKGDKNEQKKKVHDDEDIYALDDDFDTEYEDESPDHRDSLKSVQNGKGHEKSKKRDTGRTKRKKEDKNRDKKSEDYDYMVAQEREDDEKYDRTFVDEAQPSKVVDRDEFPDTGYGPLSVPEETMEKQPASDESKISKEPRDDSSYDRLMEDPAATDTFDKFADVKKVDGRVPVADEEKPENSDVQAVGDPEQGKDFEISLTGKIHLESDSNGQPVSISFNGAPEYFKEGDDSVGDETPADYGNRLSPESANSLGETSDTLSSSSGGADNANFLPDAYNGESSLSQPLEPVDDRSIARQYYLHAIRARSRNAANYDGDEAASRSQRLLRVRKKSVDGSATKQRPSGVSGVFRRSLKRSKKESSGYEADLLPGGTEAEEREVPSDYDSVESSNAEERSGISVPVSDDSLKKTSGEDSLNDSPQISIDLSNSMPENSVVNVDPITDTDSASCYSANGSTQKADLVEVTLNADKFIGALTKTTPLSIHDLDNGASTGSTGSRTTSSPSSTATAAPVTTTTTNSRNETVIEAKMSYPRPSLVAHVAKSIRKENDTENASKESIEKKNMLAVSEFVKKLEKLVSDSGNSTNTTGRTLIHLKKFIIVPDNRTFWSLKEFAAPEDLRKSSSTETVIVLGDGGRNKEYKKSVDADYSENGDDDEPVEDDQSMIKEIIDSVINEDEAKRDTPEVAKTPDDVADPPVENEAASGTDVRPVDKNCPDLTNVEDESALRLDADSRNARKNADDRYVESSLENEKKTSKKGDNVCAECKSNAKEKREAVGGWKGKGESRGNKKKEAKHPKKKRRRKRKRKVKKRKGGERIGRKVEKGTSKWPFKRNLLMLSEEEQTRPLNVDYGTNRDYGDKFSSRDGGKRRVRFARDSVNGDEPKEPQIRGRQDCSDRRHPRGVDPSKYLESAHCLRFSDLWYSVYRLQEPVIVHSVHLQLYAKHTMADGSTSWKDLTNGSSVRLGTLDGRYRNKENTVAFAYSDVKTASNPVCNLDPSRDRLLVPSTLSGKSSKYSEAEGWSNEYLVVQADKINVDANECDKAGVGFAAFVGQPDRCERVSGTCLKNQPLHYWRHDMEARESGQAGCYFLSNFARVPSEAIKYNVNGTGSHEFLALEYHSPHVSVIDVELRDDYNALLKSGSPGRLTEVHVDNTKIDYTVITVLITNKGSSSSSYRARITGCPKGLPASWSNAESPAKTIPPHRDRKVALDLNGRLSLNEFSCSVVLLNIYDEPIARREIRLRREDYCSCVRHCTCSCTNDRDGGKDCRPMSLEDYHAAGFKGPLPEPPVELLNWTDALTIVTVVLTVLLLFLLLLGFLKGLIGLCAPSVGRWGLDDLLLTDKMTEYFEKSLKSRSVVFNQSGEPVHPETGRKSVRICSRKLAFFLNLIFFYIHPLVICCFFCAKPKRTSPPPFSSAVSKASLMSERDESQKIIHVSTYGDGINSKMEEEDTKYVMEELKKSQESLQNHSRYKLDRNLTEDTSTD